MTKFPNLLQRIFTAVLGAALMVTSIIYGSWSYFAVFLGIAILTQWEFYRLVEDSESRPLKIWGLLMGILLITGTFLALQNMVSFHWLLIFFPMGVLIFIIKLFQKGEPKPFTGTANTWLGIIYIAVPFSLLHYVAFAKGQYDFQLILGCILLHWAHDVGAYFVGVRFGKTKLFERLSPKKSWEGSAGGAIVTLLVVFLGSYFADSLNLVQWSVIAAIVVVAGTLGDLVESQFKRSIEIKDSGRSIPGHGGFLDRFDSLLISTPFIAGFLKLIA